MLSSRKTDFFQGAAQIFPVALAAMPIGLVWGALAVKKDLSITEAGLTSALVFAGSLQFVALDLWRHPAPWLLLGFTALLVNVRHIIMGASLSRHVESIPPVLRPLLFFLMVDEAWALAERRALAGQVTSFYYFGLTLPLFFAWIASTLIGAVFGLKLGDPAALGLDFTFASLFIAILASFWKGPSTGVILAASGCLSALTKLFIPGAWYIAAGAVAGILTALVLHELGEGSE